MKKKAQFPPDSSDHLEDFKIYDERSELPLSGIPTYLTEGFSGICTKGTAVIDVHSNKRRIAKNDLVVIFPYQLAHITEMDEDFSMLFFKISRTLFIDTLSGMCRMTPNFFFYMRNSFSYSLDDSECSRFSYFCRLLEYRSGGSQSLFRRESIMQLLRVFYWDIYVQYRNNPEASRNLKFSHKENLAFKFFCLVMESHSVNREVSFYADKLCISSKYLTMLMQDVSGKSAKEWIIEYTILEIKALLRDTNLDIKEIVSRTHFQSQSLLSRFFRMHVGMTPTQYREEIHK